MAAVPKGIGTPFEGIFSFTVTGTPSSAPTGFRRVGVQGFQVRLPARDVLFDRREDLGWREALGTVAPQQLDRAQVMDVGHGVRRLVRAQS
jgi:hypothetical protein